MMQALIQVQSFSSYVQETPTVDALGFDLAYNGTTLYAYSPATNYGLWITTKMRQVRRADA